MCYFVAAAAGDSRFLSRLFNLIVPRSLSLSLVSLRILPFIFMDLFAPFNKERNGSSYVNNESPFF